MITIKRYANRKLYDTAAKKYITLEGIARLVQRGENVQIIDHQSGEDITAVTLAQIMFEREKQGRGALPRRMLARLLQTGEDTLASLRRSLPLPFDLARRVDEEIERRIDALVENGELEAEEGRELLAKLISQSQPMAEVAEPETVEQLMSELGVPSRSELQELLQQLEALTDEIEKLSKRA